MDVFEKWIVYSLFAVIMLVLYSDNCESSVGSGKQSVWLNGTNSSCEMCTMCNKSLIDCSNMSIKNVTVIGSHEIVGLNVSNNHLSTTPLIIDCPKLEWIDLSNNTDLKVMNEAAFRNINSSSLRILNVSNCGLLKIMPVPLKEFFPSLEILLIVNNLISRLNMTIFANMEAFWLLDVRNNPMEPFMSAYVIEEQCVTILLKQSDCKSPCGQNFYHHNYDFDYLLSICQSERQCNSSQAQTHLCPRIEYTSNTPDTIDSSITGSDVESSSSTTPGKSTNEGDKTKFVKVVAPCLGVVVLVLLISYQIRRYYKRKRRQNQYNRWLAVYTPPECVCTFQKRVSFSGEIVIKESGENMTEKKLNSHELKKSCSRQFDISLLIRTQSLPPVHREERDEKPGRVLSWI